MSLERGAFEAYLRSGRQRVAAASIEYKFNPNHDPANGQFTFGSDGGSSGAGRPDRVSGSGPRLTPQAKEVSDRIRHDFYLRTGKRVTVNSGTRSPEAQADAMLGNRANWGIYKDQRAVAEIRSAFERTRNGTHAEQVAAMGQIIDGRCPAMFTFRII